ncbi:hypothetical protein OAU96_01365 [Planctomycetota bacterium]|nr:hypothetical protein [Planctomycetota bacterium]
MYFLNRLQLIAICFFFLIFLVPGELFGQEGSCNDGLDGPDGDGYVDCDDEDCIGDPSCPILATITVDNSYAFGFGDINGIDPNQIYGCFNATQAGDIYNGSCADLNTYNSNGAERFNLSGSLNGAYIYMVCWADVSTYQGAIAQFSDSVTSLTSGIINGGVGPQWEVFATGLESPASSSGHCGLGLASLLNDVNAQVALANGYPATPIPNTAASPGWVGANGAVNGLHPNDAGNGSVLYFDPFPNGNPAAQYPNDAFSSPVGACSHFDNPAATWMWYNPDGDNDGFPDFTSPFNTFSFGTPEGEYLIFRVGPLNELFSGCSTENPRILCETETPGVDYNLTFDVVNNTGFDVTKLVIPGLVGGASITPNIINLPTPLPSGSTATGISLSISGGTPGEIICIPVGLIAEDADGEEFQCCGTEVCIELPNCCLLISDETLVHDADGNLTYSFSVTNGGGEDPVTAEHLFMEVISPAGVTVTNQWQALNGLNDNSSILLSTQIVGAAPGTTVCFEVTIHDATLNTCCGVTHCVIVPEQGPELCIPDLSCEVVADTVVLQWPIPNPVDCCGADILVLLDGQQIGSANPAAGSVTVPCANGVYCLACTDSNGNLIIQACCDVSCSPLLPTPVYFIRGDSNGDGSVDISDSVKTLNFLFHSAVITCGDALDANDDELVNIADAIFTLEALFGSTTTPWPLISDCVLDNTEGPLECNSFLACPEND